MVNYFKRMQIKVLKSIKLVYNINDIKNKKEKGEM